MHCTALKLVLEGIFNNPGLQRNRGEGQEPQPVPTVLTAMASQGDIEIEVTDPDRCPVGKIYCDSRVLDLFGGREGIFDS